MVVDLPAPLGPKKPNILPGLASKLIPFTAFCVPKFLDNSLTFMLNLFNAYVSKLKFFIVSIIIKLFTC